jgi:hypothetical protein
MLRKSEVCAIGFSSRRLALAAWLRTGVTFETEDNSGKDFFTPIARNPLKSPDSEK